MGDVIEIRTPAVSTVEVDRGTSVVESVSNAGPVAYVHSQAIPATVWTIVHRLGFDPAGVIVFDTGGYQLDGFSLQYLAPGHSLRVAFDLPFAGSAYLS